MNGSGLATGGSDEPQNHDEYDGNDESDADDLDEAISRWHEGAGGDEPLHVFLGMTWEEYAEHMERHYDADH